MTTQSFSDLARATLHHKVKKAAQLAQHIVGAYWQVIGFSQKEQYFDYPRIRSSNITLEVNPSYVRRTRAR